MAFYPTGKISYLGEDLKRGARDYLGRGASKTASSEDVYHK